LFAWLDAHVHEHGPEEWTALSAAVESHEYAPYLLEQAGKVLPDIEHDLDELRQILSKERQRVLAQRKKELAERAPTDPAAYEELRQLIAAQKTTGPGTHS
jgi:DNA primase